MSISEKLIEGLELKYTGKGFAGFNEENPFVIFMGYDTLGWTNIWVKYNGRPIFTSVFEVDLHNA
jgi:hypothetical protein